MSAINTSRQRVVANNGSVFFLCSYVKKNGEQCGRHCTRDVCSFHNPETMKKNNAYARKFREARAVEAGRKYRPHDKKSIN